MFAADGQSESTVLIPVNAVTMNNGQLVVNSNQVLASISMVTMNKNNDAVFPILGDCDNFICDICKSEFKNVSKPCLMSIFILLFKHLY